MKEFLERILLLLERRKARNNPVVMEDGKKFAKIRYNFMLSFSNLH